jgi:predicted MarR family transcription regulator
VTPAVAPFPFFVGVGRSGTTLLRSIFNAHPDLAVVNESRFVAWMADHRARYHRATGFDTERFLSDLLDNRRVPSRLREWGLAPDTVRCRVTDEDPSDLAAALRCVYGLYAERHGKGRYGDKTPRFVQDVDALGELFDEARIVHLVRDGRNVALAVSEVDFGAANVVHAAHRWARRVGRAQRAGGALGPERFRMVRYEDLTASPESVVADLCSFLDLDYGPEMLRYFEKPDEVFAGLDDQPHHENLRLPVTQGLRDWRRQMSSENVARFEAVAGDVLAELGYEVTSAARPDGQRGCGGAITGLRVLQGKAVAAGRARRRAGRRRRS